MWRLLRSLLLLFIGAVAGLAASAAVVRSWLPSRGDETSDELELVAIFDGIDLRSRSTAFRGGRVLAWFGGIALDLGDATLGPDARLDVRTLFGGVSIKVPANCRVEAETTALIGGIDVAGPDPDAPAAPVLNVRATSLFGGVSIRR